MSYLSRRVGTLVLALLTVFTFAASAAAQVNTVKDGWLVMKIHSEFVDEDVLSGSNIDVDVKNGMVTLQGTVPSEAARARAIAAAKANDGVKGVTDQLRIAAATHNSGTPDHAGDKAANTVLDDSDIDIDVTNNMVVLNGTVKSAAAKAKAVSVAKATDGVKGVKDNLKVVAGTR